jgi:hypothetical protein
MTWSLPSAVQRSATTILLQAIDGTGNSKFFRGILVWNFLFDADTDAHWLRLRTATKIETDGYGRQVVRFVERPQT